MGGTGGELKDGNSRESCGGKIADKKNKIKKTRRQKRAGERASGQAGELLVMAMGA